ncbi:hypothetical protein E2C01_076173 [Portunus trituberculatus]|uniref:Uncharacterized protein n=1 Tax=Portunus trituberculatus TaxID=210409 RepID=A0A5B7II84_PORTR|nr:hypothetical protein [Portunus trituberculatus]
MASKRPGSDSVVCEPKKKRKRMTISVQQKVDLLRTYKGVSVQTLCQQYNIEVKIQERVSIDKCIQMTTDLIETFEQHNIFTKQEIMTLYLWKDHLIKEKPKLMKQTTVDNWLKRATSACKQATAERPAASTTAATDISADASQAPKLLAPRMSLQSRPQI